MMSTASRWMQVSAWWLLSLLASISGSLVVATLGAHATGVTLEAFVDSFGFTVLLAYTGLHWAVLGWVGAVLVRSASPLPATDASDSFRFRPIDAGTVSWVAVATVGLCMSIAALVSVLSLTETGTLGAFRERLAAATPAAWWTIAVGVTVMPAFGEEIFFRGFVLRALQAAGSRHAALFASSILFAVTHLDAVQSAFTLVLGLWIGWLVLRTDSLWTGIVAHAVNNAAATIWMSADSPISPAIAVGVGLPLFAGGSWIVARRAPAGGQVERRRESEKLQSEAQHDERRGHE